MQGSFQISDRKSQMTSPSPETKEHVDLFEMEDGDIQLKGISAGTATVTLKVNGAERSFKVEVDGDDDDD